MKIKKVLSMLLVYLLFLTCIPVSFLTSSVQAAEASGQTGVYNVKAYNLFSAGNYIYSAATYGNYGLFLSNKNLYMAKENYNTVAYAGKGYISSLLGVKGDNAYLLSNDFAAGENITVVNLKTFQNKTINLLKAKSGSWVNSAVMDKSGALWFSFTKYDNKNYKKEYSILRLDTAASQTSELKLDASKITNLPELKADKVGDVWYRAYNMDNKTQKMDKLVFANNAISQTEYDIKANIKPYSFDYVVNNGDIWFKNNDGKNYTIMDLSLKNGTFDLNKSYQVKLSSRIMTDNNGSIWMHEFTPMSRLSSVNTVSKLENGNFNQKYTWNFGSFANISITDDNHMAITSYVPTTGKVKYGYVYSVINDTVKPAASTVK